MNYIQKYNEWLDSPFIDEESKKELRAIEKDEDEIKFRFSTVLEFGTGGMRSKMGAGTNMMNVYTVGQVTEGLARLIDSLGQDEKDHGVLIGHDSRNNSSLFARRAANVLSSHGIRVFLFDDVRPTPELSFGIRYLGCTAGINITASHNPKEYNGYKLYWDDGSQPTSKLAAKISEYVDSVDVLSGVPTDDKCDERYIKSLGKEIDHAFFDSVLGEAVNPEIVRKAADDLKIVYTPLFGAGAKFVPEILKKIGLKHLITVDEQMIHDGNFPGLSKPNPEYPASFELGIKLAKKVGSDLIIATDPDADRVGVMARDKNGDFRAVTGNQMGSLLLDYILSSLKEQNRLPENAYAIKTIVTSEMATEICRRFGVKLYNVLTGFKFIAEIIRQHEEAGKGTFILGYEESYGYLKGLHARDKDSIVASMLICEMAAYYSLKNMTLIDAIESLYKKYGYYTEQSAEIYKEGVDGKREIAEMMDNLRKNPPSELGGNQVINVRDYLSQTSLDVRNGKITETGLPKSNVMYFKNDSNDIVVVRPSGTEPKIKFYIMAYGDTETESIENAAACKQSLEKLLGLGPGERKNEKKSAFRKRNALFDFVYDQSLMYGRRAM